MRVAVRDYVSDFGQVWEGTIWLRLICQNEDLRYNSVDPWSLKDFFAHHVDTIDAAVRAWRPGEGLWHANAATGIVEAALARGGLYMFTVCEGCEGERLPDSFLSEQVASENGGTLFCSSEKAAPSEHQNTKLTTNPSDGSGALLSPRGTGGHAPSQRWTLEIFPELLKGSLDSGSRARTRYIARRLAPRDSLFDHISANHEQLAGPSAKTKTCYFAPRGRAKRRRRAPTREQPPTDRIETSPKTAKQTGDQHEPGVGGHRDESAVRIADLSEHAGHTTMPTVVLYVRAHLSPPASIPISSLQALGPLPLRMRPSGGKPSTSASTPTDFDATAFRPDDQQKQRKYLLVPLCNKRCHSLCVMHKPPGVLSEAHVSSTIDGCLAGSIRLAAAEGLLDNCDQTESWKAASDARLATAAIHVLHRLDRPVGGPIACKLSNFETSDSAALHKTCCEFSVCLNSKEYTAVSATTLAAEQIEAVLRSKCSEVVDNATFRFRTYSPHGKS